jgi:isochorismate synthase
MTAYAIYRLPHEDHATLIRQTDGEPAEYLSFAELNGKRGFVVAPFEVKEDQPVLLIQGETEVLSLTDIFRQKNIRDINSPRQSNRVTDISPYYKIDFANFHSQLENDQFRKIVLARCVDETMENPVDSMTLFYTACEMYPRLFIALVETQKSGCWLTATPEILLEGEGRDWRTIALAGTMKLEGEQLNGEGETLRWSTKNIQEQRIVATYITECLEQFTGEIREDGPRTVRAANLVHLRSDFTFSLPDNQHLGHLLLALHPTPAVCGLPKREAFQFITKNEHTPRRYYSGFMGPLQMEHTHLYVSLRCMNIEGNTYHLFAGGGLLKDSTEEQEWAETEAKLETMRRILDIKTE